jgi:Cu/Ag efflux pump CusA
MALPDGRMKPLKEFASVNVTGGEAEVNREDLQNLGIVTARLDNGNLGETIKEIKKRISQAVKLPTGYEIVYGGAYAEQQKSFNELPFVVSDRYSTQCQQLLG